MSLAINPRAKFTGMREKQTKSNQILLIENVQTLGHMKHDFLLIFFYLKIFYDQCQSKQYKILRSKYFLVK